MPNFWNTKIHVILSFIIDCKNGQDEKLCDDEEENKCGDFEFGCGNGECVPMNQICDGTPGI